MLIMWLIAMLFRSVGGNNSRLEQCPVQSGINNVHALAGDYVLIFTAFTKLGQNDRVHSELIVFRKDIMDLPEYFSKKSAFRSAIAFQIHDMWAILEVLGDYLEGNISRAWNYTLISVDQEKTMIGMLACHANTANEHSEWIWILMETSDWNVNYLRPEQEPAMRQRAAKLLATTSIDVDDLISVPIGLTVNRTLPRKREKGSDKTLATTTASWIIFGILLIITIFVCYVISWNVHA